MEIRLNKSTKTFSWTPADLQAQSPAFTYLSREVKHTESFNFPEVWKDESSGGCLHTWDGVSTQMA